MAQYQLFIKVSCSVILNLSHIYHDHEIWNLKKSCKFYMGFLKNEGSLILFMIISLINKIKCTLKN